MNNETIRPIRFSELNKIKQFTDRTIGQNYYELHESADIYERSLYKGQQCSLVLEIDGEIRGIRLTYPHNKWEKGKGIGLKPTEWPRAIQETAYFQSLFIDPTVTGKGYGKKLSSASIDILKSIGSRGIVCHSWKESPNDSSGKYLRGLGFALVATHPLYWKEVDYVCTRCGSPCLCTAEEMYLDLT